MDYGWMTHALMWFIGAISVIAGVGSIAALFAMGRSGYRKD